MSRYSIICSIINVRVTDYLLHLVLWSVEITFSFWRRVLATSWPAVLGRRDDQGDELTSHPCYLVTSVSHSWIPISISCDYATATWHCIDEFNQCQCQWSGSASGQWMNECSEIFRGQMAKQNHNTNTVSVTDIDSSHIVIANNLALWLLSKGQGLLMSVWGAGFSLRTQLWLKFIRNTFRSAH